MSEPTDSYTLSDLAELAEVTPRTVRWYIQQGLLRSPDSAGSSTRYDEGHLWRLRLIRQLQRDHLPLAEIRKRLLALDDDQVRSLVGGMPDAPREPAVDYIRSVLSSRGVRSSAAMPPSPSAPRMPAMSPSPLSRGLLPVPAGQGAGPADQGAGPADQVAGLADLAAPSSHLSRPDRSQWERLTLSPDLELHIRRPLSRLDNRRIDRLISIARQILEEDIP